jgi:hypothetical protein
MPRGDLKASSRWSAYWQSNAGKLVRLDDPILLPL